MTTQQKISLAILTKVQAGMSIEQAIDAALGAGTFSKLASDVYDELRARQ
jgi:hypothetical protein